MTYFKLPIEEDCGFVATLNKTGFMTTTLDPYSQEFLEQCQAGHHILEIGSAYGVATIPALQKGCTVYANDLSQDHLNILKNHTPLAYQDHLHLLSGDFLEQKIPTAFFDMCFSARVFHFFTGEQIMKALAMIFQALKPLGKLFLVNDTPYMNDYQSFIPLFEERLKNNVPWPGIIEDVYSYAPKRKNNVPSFFNLLDPQTLTRACTEAGFKVIKSSFIAREDFPVDLKLDGRESVGLVAIKDISE